MGRPAGQSGKAPTLKSDQIKRLLAIASTGKFGERNQTVVTMSYWLGLRAKELASLRVGDIYEADGSIRPVLHLKATYTKRAKTRDVFLSAGDVQKRLKAYWPYLVEKHMAREDMPLFATRSRKGFSPNGMVRLLCELHQQSGVANGSSHSGRRTMITRLAENGVDLKAIATLAGHASISTTAGYVQDNPERLAKIMAGVGIK